MMRVNSTGSADDEEPKPADDLGPVATDELGSRVYMVEGPGSYATYNPGSRLALIEPPTPFSVDTRESAWDRLAWRIRLSRLRLRSLRSRLRHRVLVKVYAAVRAWQRWRHPERFPTWIPSGSRPRSLDLPAELPTVVTPARGPSGNSSGMPEPKSPKEAKMLAALRRGMVEEEVPFEVRPEPLALRWRVALLLRRWRPAVLWSRLGRQSRRPRLQSVVPEVPFKAGPYDPTDLESPVPKHRSSPKAQSE